jgi:hypothetical protein
MLSSKERGKGAVQIDRSPEQILGKSNSSAVDDFVAVKAHDFNKVQQTSISRLQQVQQQSLGINRIQ